MSRPISLTFDNLTHLATHMSDDTSIVVKNGGFETRGKIGTFFTRKSTNRHAGNVLFAAVRQQYGDAVADALAPRMRAFRQEGMPLSARAARDILADAAAMHEGLGRINADMARHFVLANDGRGDTRNLDTAFDAFCASHAVDPADRQQLKNLFGEAVLRAASQETGKLLSYAQLGDMVKDAALPAMKKAWNAVQAQRFLDGGGADQAVDACAAKLGLDGAQKQDLRRVAVMAVMNAAQKAAEENKPFDAQAMSRAVAEGSLPELQNFAFACGRAINVDAVARDMMAWATPAARADAAMLTEVVAKIGGVAAGALAMQRLGEMRAAQPEGPLTRETIWQGCFHEPMPEDLKEATQRGFSDAMFGRLENLFKALDPDSPTIAATGMTTLSAGLSLEKTLESLRGPISLSIADFALQPSLTAVQNLGTLQEVEVSLALDIKRRGTHSALPGYMPTVSFGVSGGEVETVRIQDTAGMKEEDVTAYRAGRPSSMSHGLVERALRLCEGNEVQARQVIQSMGQSGAFLVRTGTPVTGIAESEHSPLDIDVRRQTDGSVTMRFHKPDASPLDVDYTFIVMPDGSSRLTACRMQARAPQPVGE